MFTMLTPVTVSPIFASYAYCAFIYDYSYMYIEWIYKLLACMFFQ